MKVSVAMSGNIREVLSYKIDESINPSIGQRVIVPLANSFSLGWIVDLDSDYQGRCKEIFAVIEDSYFFPPAFINFAQKMGNQFLNSCGIYLDFALSPRRKGINSIYLINSLGKEIKLKNMTAQDLRKELKLGKKSLRAFYKSKSIEKINCKEENISDKKFSQNFYYGKNRFKDYLKNIKSVYEKGGSILFVCNDSLKQKYLKDFFFSYKAKIYNSSLKIKDKEELWNRSQNEQVFIIGGESALLLPIYNLSLLVYEESFYNYDWFKKKRVDIDKMAFLRASSFQIPYIKGGAVIDIEAYSKGFFNKDEQVSDRKIDIYPLKINEKKVPSQIIDTLRESVSLEKKIAIINGRKEGRIHLYCPNCKESYSCSCKSILFLSKNKEKLKCLSCKNEISALSSCPKCLTALVELEELSLRALGKTIKEEIGIRDYKILETDIFNSEDFNINEIVNNNFILLSTALMINPYFYDKFDLVLILRPESMINMKNYDSSYKIFSLINEAYSLLKSKGSLEVFSVFHFNFAIKNINNTSTFLQRELEYREWFKLPPFYNRYLLTFRNKDLRKVASYSRKFYQQFKDKVHISLIRVHSYKPFRSYFKVKVELHCNIEQIYNLEKSFKNIYSIEYI